MFSSSFTMSEQEHRQGTPYKHDAPARSGRSAVARPAARSARASGNLRCDLQFGLRESRREKCCAGMKATTKARPARRSGSGRKGETGHAT